MLGKDGSTIGYLACEPGFDGWHKKKTSSGHILVGITLSGYRPTGFIEDVVRSILKVNLC